MIQPRFIPFLCLFFSLFAGCAGINFKPPTATQLAQWQQHQTRLNAIKTWRITGRIAIQTDSDNWTANTYWTQNKTDYELRFNTPTGQGALLLQGSPQQVTLKTSENETYTAQDPDTLIEEVTHLPLPVSNLYYWIRGLSYGDLVTNTYELDDAGRLSQLQQANWGIRYERYDSFNGYVLPTKLTLTNNQFTVKIVISQWQLQPAETTVKSL
ncbi:outer membrane lipoprotein LolB [Beggiatoa alba B18LD]|uniref:Outer-membrane lipoprotein LolB n=1 Tax=Beggiatoa alba B18LD TaxID=395493 RepID=I3CG51_9GAMM|nr:lipoprotein insertase outer membrane protein LolB [Beggiatoa alba]EIJ42594.1 outer membrane lipoprotein LolB [Beggiatoa alba B18LD]